jgi:hypothetical protein
MVVPYALRAPAPVNQGVRHHEANTMPLPAWISWDTVGTVLNSAFTTSLVGALTGAFAGARAAQRIAERSKEAEQLLAQIRAINAAISASFVVCNLLLALKRQHVKPLYDTFVAKKAELQEFHRRRRAGEIPSDQPFEFTADLRTLQMPLVPIAVLERLVFEKLSVVGRPLALTTSLAGVAASLAELMQRRSSMIEQFKQVPSEKQALVAALYFGHAFAEGRVSTEYADTLEALSTQTDNGIFFSQLLCKDLAESGASALEAYKRIAKKSTEHISSIDFKFAREQGLMPDEALYQDWLRGFQAQPQAGSPR